MKIPYVDLPRAETIECWWLARLIALATHPTLEETKGIGCVLRKKWSHSDTGEQYSHLSAEDRIALEPLLVGLPELHGRMSDAEIHTFTELYSALPNRLPWVPVLNDTANTERIKSEQFACQSVHLAELGQRHRDGKLQAFTKSRLPAKSIDPNVSITHEQAVVYLQACGLFPERVSDVDLLSISQPTSIDSHPATSAETSSVRASLSVIASPTSEIEAKKHQKRGPKRDFLTQAIEDFQRENPGRGTLQAMWIEFSRMAKKEVFPFIREVDGVLFYNAAKGSKSLTFDALRLRLIRQASKQNSPLPP